MNQFLTELDGVSGLNGVVVLAATSRPDLIDPALLRPGRLDRLLLCDFPGRDARLEILERSVRDCAGFEDQRAFNEDQLGLHAVAKATEGFSGADLRALATDAHMHAVHRAMESETPSDEGEVVEAVVTREDVARAAREARRSVPARERERLDANLLRERRRAASEKAISVDGTTSGPCPPEDMLFVKFSSSSGKASAKKMLVSP